MVASLLAFKERRTGFCIIVSYIIQLFLCYTSFLYHLHSAWDLWSQGGRHAICCERYRIKSNTIRENQTSVWGKRKQKPAPKILSLLEFWFFRKEITTIQAFKANFILKKINMVQRWAVFLGFFLPISRLNC